MTKKIQALRAQLAVANDALNAALGAGEDTSEPRHAVASIENEIASLEQLQHEEQSAAAAAEQAAIEEAANEAADTIHAAIEKTTEVNGLDDLAGEPFKLMRDRLIDSLTREMERHRAALKRADAELKPLIESANNLKARLAEKQAGIHNIKNRRSSGDERDGDAAELTLLQSDIHSLEGMLTEASRKVTAADTRDAARTALANAERELAHQQNLVAVSVAKARAELAEQILLEAAAKARAAAKAASAAHHLVYAPSSELRRLVVGVY